MGSYEYRVEMQQAPKSATGLYKCLVANDNGQMQVYLNLDLEAQRKEVPTFDETPKITTLNNGKLIQMIARYQASDKCNCTWSKKGVAPSENETVKIFHEKIDIS